MTTDDRYRMPGQPPTDEDLEREVELTRRELSATVTELAQRVNVKERARQATRSTVDRTRAAVRRNQPAVAAGVGLLLAVSTLVIILLRRR